jgi:hypothetical protein
MADYFETPLFSIVGRRPVKSVTNPENGNFQIVAYDWQNGGFLPALEYLDRLYMGNDFDVQFITEHEFDDYVATLEIERLHKG